MAKGKGLNRQRPCFKLESGLFDGQGRQQKILYYVSRNAFDGTAVELENDSVNQNTATIATLQLCLNKTGTAYYTPLLGLCIGMLSMSVEDCTQEYDRGDQKGRQSANKTETWE
jgi:hypothetical protein